MNHTIVVAPDSFKGSASASEVARAVAEGWRRVRPFDEVVFCPMADGGEGTLDAFELAVAGTRREFLTVDGPADRPVDTYFLWLPDGTAVVELASTSGLTLMGSLDPLGAHTRGFGQAIAHALDAGATRLILGLGGSASTDGGVGALAALGARFLDDNGALVGDGGGGLSRVAAWDRTSLRPLPPRGALALTDVSSPLVGVAGAAFVFGAQKGADTAQILALDAGLENLAHVVGADRFRAGAGAAGGVGYGMLAWGADIAPGADVIAATVDLRAKLSGASLLVSGEGQFDSQSSQGKVLSHLLDVARDVGVPTALIAGRVAASTERFRFAESLTLRAGSVESAMTRTQHWVSEAAAHIAQEFSRDTQ